MSRKILVTRFSAMGDVAMLVPVLKNVLEQNHDVQITLVTRGFFRPFFKNIERLSFLEVDLEGKHQGILGLYKLAQMLKKEKFDAYADLHNVLRTQILRIFLHFSISEIISVNKGRKEKKALTRKRNKIFNPLKTTFDRYAEVFRLLGIEVNLKRTLIQIKKTLPLVLQEKINFDTTKKHIGVAPFAQHEGKMYPFERIQNSIKKLAQNSELQLYLFGGGEKEKKLLENIEKQVTNAISLVGKTTLEEELQIIRSLDVMVSMDSANMHMASLVGTPVISFWGATHPHAGFMGFGQSNENSIQRDDLSCRPCSVYGNKSCWRKDWACLDLDEQIFVRKVNEFLTKID